MPAPYLPMVPRGTYNAQTLPLGQSPELAADNYGVSPNNAVRYFQRIYADRATEDGGSEQIYNKLVQWSSPEAIRARGGDPNDLQWRLMRQAVTTGEVDPRLNPALLQRGLGLGLTETARHQQHKPISMLERIGGPLLTIAASAIPVVGPYAGAAVGGYMGSRHGGGPFGTLLGMAGGYMGGRSFVNAGGVSGVYNSAREGIRNLFGVGGFTNPAALGVTGGNLALPGLANAPAATAVGGYGAGALGFTGNNLGLGLASGLGAAAPYVGQGTSTIVRPESVYNPVSMGGSPGPSPIDNALARGATTLLSGAATDFVGNQVRNAGETEAALGALGFLPEQAYDTRGGRYIAPLGKARSRRLARVLAGRT